MYPAPPCMYSILVIIKIEFGAAQNNFALQQDTDSGIDFFNIVVCLLHTDVKKPMFFFWMGDE